MRSPPTLYRRSQEYTTAVFYETIRLFTPVARLGKCVQSDTTLPARQFVSGDYHNAEKITIRIPRGSIIIMDILALHRNRKHCLLHSSIF